MDRPLEFAAEVLCPLQVEILLHYSYSAEGFGGGGAAARDYMERFAESGILDPSTSPWSLTDKGRAWVSAILSTPLPTRLWVLSDGRLLQPHKEPQ